MDPATAAKVGIAFVNHYYSRLAQEPYQLYKLYSPHATLCWSPDTETYCGTDIKRRLEKPEVGGGTYELTTAKYIPSVQGSVLIHVTGKVARGTSAAHFSQVFVLEASGGSYYVLNDSLSHNSIALTPPPQPTPSQPPREKGQGTRPTPTSPIGKEGKKAGRSEERQEKQEHQPPPSAGGKRADQPPSVQPKQQKSNNNSNNSNGKPTGNTKPWQSPTPSASGKDQKSGGGKSGRDLSKPTTNGTGAASPTASGPGSGGKQSPKGRASAPAPSATPAAAPAPTPDPAPAPAPAAAPAAAPASDSPPATSKPEKAPEEAKPTQPKAQEGDAAADKGKGKDKGKEKEKKEEKERAPTPPALPAPAGEEVKESHPPAKAPWGSGAVSFAERARMAQAQSQPDKSSGKEAVQKVQAPSTKPKQPEKPAAPALHSSGGLTRRSGGNTSIYIGKLPGVITEEDLMDTFGQFGKINATRLRVQKRIAFIDFSTKEAVEEAVKKGQTKEGVVINGQRVAVEDKEENEINLNKKKQERLQQGGQVSGFILGGTQGRGKGKE